MTDKIKLSAAALLLAGAIAAFYYYAAQASLLVRVLGLLAAAIAAAAVFFQTESGRKTWTFLQEARSEVRRVVWPTRQETMQTTLLVFVAVIIVAIFLWLLDMLLLWLVRLATGQGG